MKATKSTRCSPLLRHQFFPNFLALARNPEFHERTKHIDVRYHFLRRLAAENNNKRRCVWCGRGTQGSWRSRWRIGCRSVRGHGAPAPASAPNFVAFLWDPRPGRGSRRAPQMDGHAHHQRRIPRNATSQCSSSARTYPGSTLSVTLAGVCSHRIAPSTGDPVFLPDFSSPSHPSLSSPAVACTMTRVFHCAVLRRRLRPRRPSPVSSARDPLPGGQYTHRARPRSHLPARLPLLPAILACSVSLTVLSLVARSL